MKRIFIILILLARIVPFLYGQETDYYVSYAEDRGFLKHSIFGYKDARTGETVIPARYTDETRRFSEGFAAVQYEKKWGYIDGKGNVVIPFQFSSATNFSDGLATVRIKSKYFIINKKGDIVHTGILAKIDVEGVSRKLLPVLIGKKYGCIDSSGKIVIPCQFNGKPLFCDGLAPVEQGKKLGYINEAGEWTITVDGARFLSIFSEGMACVLVGKKFGFIDTTGKFVIPCEYDSGGPFRSGIVCVEKNGKFGYIDKNGKTVIPFKFRNAGTFTEDGLASASEDNKLFGFIDTTGNFVIEPQYSRVSPFIRGLASVAENKVFGPQNGYIDTTGRLVIPYQYDLAGNFDSAGLALVGKRTAVNPRKVVDHYEYFTSSPIFAKEYEQRSNSQYGNIGYYYYYIDKTGTNVVKPRETVK